MFLLKIMSDQNLPDNDMTKNYKMIAIGSGDQFEFYHDPENGLPMAQIVPKEGERYSVELTGNAYVVSETGKTVSSHWARSLWGRPELKITMEEGVRDSGSTVVESESNNNTALTRYPELRCTYYAQALHLNQEPSPFNINRPSHAQMYNGFDNVQIINISVQYDVGGDIVGDGTVNSNFAVNVNDLFTEVNSEGDVTAYTITETRPVKQNGNHGYFVKFKSLGRLNKLQRDNLETKTMKKVKQPTTVGDLVDAELARQALLNGASPTESKITYTA